MKNLKLKFQSIFQIYYFRLESQQKENIEVSELPTSMIKIRYDILKRVHDETEKTLKKENEGLKSLLLEYIPDDNYFK